MPSRPDMTSRSAAEDFFLALEEARWADAVGFVDPEAIEDFHSRELASVVSWAENRVAMRKAAESGVGMYWYTSDSVLSEDKLAQFADTTLRAVPGAATLGDLAKFSPSEFLALFLELSNPPAAPTKDGPFARAHRRVLGQVTEGDALAHVVYRRESPAIKYDNPYHIETVPVVRRDGRWYVALSSRYHDLVNSFGFTQLARERPQFPHEEPGAV